MNTFFSIYFLIGALFAALDIYIASRALKKLGEGDNFSFVEEEEYAETLQGMIDDHGGSAICILLILFSVLAWPLTVYSFLLALFFGRKQ